MHCSKANTEKGNGSTITEEMDIGEVRDENPALTHTYLPPKTITSNAIT